MYGSTCIIYDNKICDECGDCNFCDINPDKICDNCGNCIQDYDYNGIQIDELADEENNDAVLKVSLDYKDSWKFNKGNDIEYDDEVIFIEDIPGLSEYLEQHQREHEDEHIHDHDHDDSCDCGHDHHHH
ncbi:hypothetical protein OXPF_13120 [Oxobacter pfennigii]|uniref:Uncharacterized protein n=1 Tax=Oxobacter pfennigii TaxID=36849 RepID=A0A0P8YYH4_9CLOT|nr:hypothetical protein [Oxobacter pfennigii]KPU44837.1 hypothetical protein OXPF_13120 [Oxobacter pfennigii]